MFATRLIDHGISFQGIDNRSPTALFAVQNPQEARALLRSGAFSGLRDSVRSVGEYLSQQQSGSSATPTGEPSLAISFLRTLESFDQSLMMAVREGKSSADEDSQAKLRSVMDALDK